MEKIDLKKQWKALYQPSAKAVVRVDVPELNYLMVDGEGDPNTSESFQEAVEALFTLSYTLKFMVKKGARAIDYGVMPLEGLWWADDPADFVLANKARWKWTLMIAQPEFITTEDVAAAREEARRKKKDKGLERVRFEAFAEGASAQILYVGAFADEGPAIEGLHQAIAASGNTLRGQHHEIYLSDSRKTAPEKLKTILRQPFA
ncbi:GyrI-like domain-containing protein [Telmatobacter bradus]|uniref:GyrI-like domain-containing protein n=1 Tax=Telmatobacter bradus TaxID=474953 RepID=UPI003B43AB26